MNPFEGAVTKKPTRKHRLAIWENMLGTVFAKNDNGETQYFDYDYEGAREFAGASESGRDLRVWRNPVRTQELRPRQWALYVLRKEP